MSPQKHYLNKNIVLRFAPTYFWRPDDQKYFSTNFGLTYIFIKKKNSKIYLISEVGHFNRTFKHNIFEKESGGVDFQIGIGLHWTPLLNIGTIIEFTYSFSKSKTVNFPDGYRYTDIKAKDRLIGKISYLF